tara:strand:+ start:2095 stop:2856 length:762 start_codon:yes stop_codon:yes gene_type:complete
MKFILKIVLIFLISKSTFSREPGETEITTDDGIEVYQNEKYYLLKKNVKIISDNFVLSADNVKINFNNSLYDVVSLNAQGNAEFISNEFKMNGNSKILNFNVKLETLNLEGFESKLLMEDIEMYSDAFIEVDNQKGNFTLKGPNSKLINKNIFIEAEFINGKFIEDLGEKQIKFLNVADEKISYIKNNDTEMYAKKINFDNETSLIELIDDVTIIRNDEKISGDYGTLDTKNNSYKIKSNNKTKVKVIIKQNE